MGGLYSAYILNVHICVLRREFQNKEFLFPVSPTNPGNQQHKEKGNKTNHTQKRQKLKSLEQLAQNTNVNVKTVCTIGVFDLMNRTEL